MLLAVLVGRRGESKIIIIQMRREGERPKSNKQTNLLSFPEVLLVFLDLCDAGNVLTVGDSTKGVATVNAREHSVATVASVGWEKKNRCQVGVFFSSQKDPSSSSSSSSSHLCLSS